MACDPHVLRPGHLPTPFTAAESRAAAPGMPLRFEERVNPELVFSSTAIEDRRP